MVAKTQLRRVMVNSPDSLLSRDSARLVLLVFADYQCWFDCFMTCDVSALDGEIA